MIGLMKWFLERVDFLKLAEAQRGRNSRRASARLHVSLVIAYDIIELFQVLLDELAAALATYQRKDDRYNFSLNLHRTTALLSQQANNLDQIDYLFRELYAEMSLLDSSFERTYSEMFSGKFSILLSAQQMLTMNRLPVHEDHPLPPAEGDDLIYRTLWFSPETPVEDRENTRRYLHGYTGREKHVVDVHISDGEPFFRELERYFGHEKPFQQLQELKAVAENYKQALIAHLTLSDILIEIGTITKRANWGK